MSLSVFGTDRRNRTSTSSDMLRAVTIVFVVRVVRPNDSASWTSSL